MKRSKGWYKISTHLLSTCSARRQWRQSLYYQSGSVSEMEKEVTSFKVLSKVDVSRGIGRLGEFSFKSNRDQRSGNAVNGDTKDYVLSNTMETPMFFIHTQVGSVPHLTAEGLGIIFKPKSIPPLQLSIDTMYTLSGCIGPSNMSISKFVGLPVSGKALPTLLTVHDPLSQLPSNYNDRSGVSIWTRLGRRSLSVEGFKNFVSEFQPSFYQLLSDYDVSKESSMKRFRKSISRNLEYMTQLLGEIEGHEGEVYVTLEISWFLVDERESSSAISKILEKRNHITGFMISGFSTLLNETDMDGNTLNAREEVFAVVKTLVSRLPEDKPKYVSGPLTPLEILELVELGVDQFDSSVVTKLTENGQAFGFPFSNFLPSTSTHSFSENLAAHSNGSMTNVNSALQLGGNSNLSSEETDENITLFLSDKRYFEDFRPVMGDCDCYTCRKFTRSYVHHLLVTEELLGKVLLMSHNLYHFNNFFEAIRSCLSKYNNLKKLQDAITSKWK